MHVLRLPVRLVELDAAGRVERLVAGGCEIVADSCWIRGSCEMAGQGYCLLQWPSIGSSPWLPCTWYSHSAFV